jgi:hypothetical protein
LKAALELADKDLMVVEEVKVVEITHLGMEAQAATA